MSGAPVNLYGLLASAVCAKSLKTKGYTAYDLVTGPGFTGVASDNVMVV